MKKPLRLGDLELEVLEHLWAHGEANAKSVHEQLGSIRSNSLNTIQSTLDRLFKKQVLSRRKVAHAFHYQARYSRTEILTRKIDDLVNELSGGETRAVLAAFVEFTSRLDRSQLDELESLISASRQSSDGKP